MEDFVLGLSRSIIYAGDLVYCHNPIPGLSKGQLYRVISVISEYERVEVMDNAGKVCHFNASRFSHNPVKEADPGLN